ncbi:MAG: hypothetical protein ACXWOV_07500, partial [Isosphaeraceae bacterium]
KVGLAQAALSSRHSIPRNKNTRLEIVSPAQSSPVMLGVLPGSPRKEEARPAVSTTGGRA